MSAVRRIAVLVALIVLGACSSDSEGFSQPPPTSVPPALAFVEEQPPSIAFAEDLETLVSEAGLWSEVAATDDLAECLRLASGSDASNVDGLQADIEAIGPGGQLIIADCLTGA